VISRSLKILGIVLVLVGVGIGVHTMVVVFAPDWQSRASVVLTAVGFVVYFSHYLFRRPADVEQPPVRPDR
jgi:amino acid permease